MASMLPVLDLAEADAEPAEFRARLREAAHDSGFFYLVGHGVPQAQVDQVLGLAREFFALPLDAKNEISQLKSPQFRGYSRIGGELTNGKVDWREQIDIGPERPVIDGAEGYWRLQGPNLWPSTAIWFSCGVRGVGRRAVGGRASVAASLGSLAGRGREHVRCSVRRPTRHSDQGGVLSGYR